MNQTNTISVSGIGHYAVKYYCANWHSKMAMIRKYGKINDWDVSNVTNMSSLFHVSGADSFNQPLNNWNVSKVTNMWTRSRFDRLWFGFSPRVAVPGGSA